MRSSAQWLIVGKPRECAIEYRCANSILVCCVRVRGLKEVLDSCRGRCDALICVRRVRRVRRACTQIGTLTSRVPSGVQDTDDADLNCPGGGKFYACTTGSMFLGCCKSNPCGSTCSNDDLTPASFNASYSGSFPSQFCPTGEFYSCSAIDPTFLGCCKNNPCQSNGCSSKNLVAASLLDLFPSAVPVCVITV